MMSISQVLEVALGMTLIYYLMGLVVSWISKGVMDILETRGKALEGYLKRIVGTKSLGQLVSMPQIRSQAPVRYNGLMGIFSRNVKVVEKKVEKIPAQNLVDAFFDLAQIDPTVTGDELLALVNKLPPSEGKTEMLRLINSGVTRATELRNKMGLWLDGLMAQSAAMFKALARRYVIIFSVCLTLLLGVDSIDLFRQLWANPDMRAIAAVKAQVYVDQNGYAADPAPLLADLNQLNPQIGWATLLKNAPSIDTPLDFLQFWLFKAIGLFITAVAVSQGSSFWYDVLRKISQARASDTNANRVSDENPPTPPPGSDVALG
jgi:hypothetical protein